MGELRFKGIVKVQLPIGGTETTDALIYSRNRRVQVMVNKAVVEEVAAGRVKFFMFAHVDKQGKLNLERDAGDQSW